MYRTGWNVKTGGLWDRVGQNAKILWALWWTCGFYENKINMGKRVAIQLLMEELCFGVNTRSEYIASVEKEEVAGNERTCDYRLLSRLTTPAEWISLFEWVKINASFLGFPCSNTVQYIFNPAKCLAIFFLNHSTNCLAASYTTV